MRFGASHVVISESPTEYSVKVALGYCLCTVFGFLSPPHDVEQRPQVLGWYHMTQLLRPSSPHNPVSRIEEEEQR